MNTKERLDLYVAATEGRALPANKIIDFLCEDIDRLSSDAQAIRDRLAKLEEKA